MTETISKVIAGAWVLVGLLALIRAFVVLADSVPGAVFLTVFGAAFLLLGYRLLTVPTSRLLVASAILGAASFIFILPAMAGSGAGPWGSIGIALLLMFGATAVLSLAARRGIR